MSTRIVILLLNWIVIGTTSISSQRRDVMPGIGHYISVYCSSWFATYVVEPSPNDIIKWTKSKDKDITFETFAGSRHIALFDSLRASRGISDNPVGCHETPTMVVVYRNDRRRDTIVFTRGELMLFNGRCHLRSDELLRSFLILLPYWEARQIFSRLSLSE